MSEENLRFKRAGLHFNALSEELKINHFTKEISSKLANRSQRFDKCGSVLQNAIGEHKANTSLASYLAISL
jgi:hypothetical protein